MFLRVINYIKLHKKLVLFLVILLSVLVPIFIHVLYKIPTSAYWLQSTWTAGELLNYYGTLLGFFGTVLFSALALWQNELIKEEADRANGLREELEKKRIEPRFDIKCRGSSGNFLNMHLSIQNLSDEKIYNLIIDKIRVVDDYNDTIVNPNLNTRIERSLINAGETKESVQLNNPELKTDNHNIEFNITCKDIYSKEHKFIVKSYRTEKDYMKIAFDIRKVE